MSVTRYYLDTEFYEDGKTITPISIGLVCEDGRDFYAEMDTFNVWSRVPKDHWLWENVKPHLTRPGWQNEPHVRMFQNPPTVAGGLQKFVNHGRHRPEFWAYFADYDWVLLCQLFGRMVDLPASWPKMCLDLKQEMLRLGVSKEDLHIPEPSHAHHALEDARWNRMAHLALMDLERQR